MLNYPGTFKGSLQLFIVYFHSLPKQYFYPAIIRVHILIAKNIANYYQHDILDRNKIPMYLIDDACCFKDYPPRKSNDY